MSENENFIILLNRIETTLPILERIETMLLQQTLLNKEVLNSKEAAIYMGLSQSYVCKLARRNKFPSSRPNNGKCYFQRRDLYNWLVSIGRDSNSPITEAEKMVILNPERG